ncbi:hypothetical protein BJV74DRAFT_459911 [Russula compacta]|nr:hypothetical protein BJV74DRAFT_459911 [Russula compacta]
MPSGSKYCITAQKGGTCTDSKCSKDHGVIYCEPCDCYFPTSSLQQHRSGKQHLRNAASSHPSKTGTLRPSPPSQPVSSGLQSLSPANPSPLSRSHASTPDVNPRVTVSGQGGPSTTAAYCTATLQGDTCTDHRCPYRHDVLRCEPCGRSFPSSLLSQHESGSSHLRNIAANGATNPKTSQQPLPSQRAAPSPQPTQLKSASPQSGNDSPILVIAPLGRIMVSHEDGLDFDVLGTGTPADPSFLSISHTILIEGVNMLSSLTVQSMTLSPSPSPCFTASLLGKTAVVQQKVPRKVLVSFNPPHAGTFTTLLYLVFSDQTRPSNREFTITRELRGCATLPVSPTNNDDTPKTVEAGGEDFGITVSNDSGLEFSVECPLSDEPFAAQTQELVITKPSSGPLVTLEAVVVRSLDDSTTCDCLF